MMFCVKNSFVPWKIGTGFGSDVPFDEWYEKESREKVLVGRNDVGWLGFLGLVNGDVLGSSGSCLMSSTRQEWMILGSNSIFSSSLTQSNQFLLNVNSSC